MCIRGLDVNFTLKRTSELRAIVKSATNLLDFLFAPEGSFVVSAVVSSFSSVFFPDFFPFPEKFRKRELFL